MLQSNNWGGLRSVVNLEARALRMRPKPQSSGGSASHQAHALFVYIVELETLEGSDGNALIADNRMERLARAQARALDDDLLCAADSALHVGEH